MYKILIVDDEEPARYGIRRVLENKDRQIFEAANAQTARDVIKHHRPHLMLVDINMPDEDGISLVRSLAEDPLKPLVIVITAYQSVKIAVETMKAGADDYLTKPFEIDDLRSVVRRALDKFGGEISVGGRDGQWGHPFRLEIIGQTLSSFHSKAENTRVFPRGNAPKTIQAR